MTKDISNAEQRESDRAAVLNAAVRSFWSNGYKATTVQQISRSAGIEAKWIYTAFGGKRMLYKKVLAYHVTHNFAGRMFRMSQLPPRDAIAAFLGEVVERSLHDEDRKGCILVNAAIEIAREDSELNEAVVDGFMRMEEFFRGCIERGQASGEISGDLSADDLARMFLGTLLGILVLAKTRPERELFEGMVRQAMTVLSIDAAHGP
jgi:TetR/AcrR family transcriptional repressor of nem operon